MTEPTYKDANSVIVIETREDTIRVYFREPTPDAVIYTLAEFPISTAFTRRMAATVACDYSDRSNMPIDMASLDLSMRNHCHRVERARPDLIVTYKMKMGEPV